MKTYKSRLWLKWLKHREAIIIIVCSLFLLFGGLFVAEYMIQNYPVICLAGFLVFIAVVLLWRQIDKRIDNAKKNLK